MGSALNVQAWSTTASSNDGADSTIGTVANTSSPASVDDWVRGVMAAIAKYADDTGGALVAGGSATALTVTTGQSLSSAHIANGLRLCVRTASAATGAATIAVDGLTAVDIKKNDGTSVASGEWASGAILDLVYSSTASAFLVANIGPAYTLDITSLTGLTAPDHAADYIPIYDTSASGNRKVLPRYLAPSIRACFKANKSTTDQALSTTGSLTTISFGTENYDVGSYFASNAWVPPAGKVSLTAVLSVKDDASASAYIGIFKNLTTLVGGVQLTTGTGGEAGLQSVTIHTEDDATGSDSYTVRYYATASGYTVYADDDITGAAYTASYFMGHMI